MSDIKCRTFRDRLAFALALPYRDRSWYLVAVAAIVRHKLATMDGFGYFAAGAAPANGFNVPFGNERRDNWSPFRDELAELIRRLRARYGRRRVFRRRDVEDIILEMRPWNPPAELAGRRLLFGEPLPAPVRREVEMAPPTPDRTEERPVRRARVEIDLTVGDE